MTRSTPVGRRPATMPAMATTTDRLPFTGDDEADRLLVERAARPAHRLRARPAGDGPEGVQRARSSSSAGSATSMPRGSRRRDPASLDAVFRERPALHRFPGSMAGKVQALCAAIAERLRRRRRPDLDGGDATARTSQRRLLALPGIGEMKAGTLIADPRQAARRRAAGLDERRCRRTRRSATSTPPRRWPTTRPASGRARPRCAPRKAERAKAWEPPAHGPGDAGYNETTPVGSRGRSPALESSSSGPDEPRSLVALVDAGSRVDPLADRRERRATKNADDEDERRHPADRRGPCRPSFPVHSDRLAVHSDRACRCLDSGLLWMRILPWMTEIQ